MATLMLVNPRKRRSTKRRASAGKRTRRTRRAAPSISVSTVKRRAYRRARPARRANPIHGRTARRIRRRRNPISMRSLSGGSIMRMLKDAAIGGSGAVAIDVIMAKLNAMLPPSLQPSAAGVGANDAVRVAVTVALGKFLSKPTRGLSEKMASGALIVQAARLIAPLVAKVAPGAVAGVGYATPYAVIPGSARVSPIGRGGSVGAFMPAGARTPLLSGAGVGAFTRGASPLLSASRGGRGSTVRAR